MFINLKKSVFQSWRLLPPIGFVAGMLLPWRLAYSDVMDFSNEAWPVYGWWEIKDSFNSLSRLQNYASQFINYRLVDIVMLIGAFSLVLYFFGNFYQVITRSTKSNNDFLLFLRITSISSALILLPDFIYPMMNSEASIGYHITAISIFGSFLLEGNDSMNLNAKYPYLTAWAGIIALNALAGVALYIVPYEIIRLFLQIIIGFFIFKFVIERNVLPYIAKHDTKIENSKIG